MAATTTRPASLRHSTVLAVVGVFADEYTESVDRDLTYAYLSWPELAELEQSGSVPTPAAAKEPEEQISMLDLTSQQVCQALRSISVETLTPIEAMNELYKLRKMLE